MRNMRMDREREMIGGARCGKWDKVFEYLDQGANIHARDLDDESLLEYAVDKNCYYAAEELLKRGHDVNAIGSAQITPLFCARTEKMIRLLAQYGANPNHEVNGITPLAIFFGEDNIEGIRCYIDIWGMPTVFSKKAVRHKLRTRKYVTVEALTGIKPTEDEANKLEKQHPHWLRKTTYDTIIRNMLRRSVVELK